ncbi:hypothetical protein PIB30_020406 [Stylosanthes scabra]|uniref:Uncharacterized protein n=1 Tax=Stylosanthes scabra TaxID=79078 RepID=A0ABU6R8Z1_9FABA|nr:hypothetical protein [Stylosanthes scabra]
MAALFQALPPPAAFSSDSNKFYHSPSPRSLSERKCSILTVRSDARLNPLLNSATHKPHRFITNAVATKPDTSLASTSSKPGYVQAFLSMPTSILHFSITT